MSKHTSWHVMMGATRSKAIRILKGVERGAYIHTCIRSTHWIHGSKLSCRSEAQLQVHKNKETEPKHGTATASRWPLIILIYEITKWCLLANVWGSNMVPAWFQHVNAWILELRCWVQIDFCFSSIHLADSMFYRAPDTNQALMNSDAVLSPHV